VGKVSCDIDSLLTLYPLSELVCATPEDTPEHAAHLAILLRALSHFTTHSFLTSISALVAPYENEARKKVLSAYYVPRAILRNMTLKAHPSSLLPLPSLPRRFQAAPQFSACSVDKVSMKSISMSFRRSSINIYLSNLSSLLSTTRFFSHLLLPPRAPLSMNTTLMSSRGLSGRPRSPQLNALPPSRCHSLSSDSPSLLNTW
jgi:hypothetical protein